MLQACFLLLIYFRVGSADSEGSGPDDTGPVGPDLGVIVDTGPTGSGLRDLDSVDTGPTGSADTGHNRIFFFSKFSHFFSNRRIFSVNVVFFQ